MTAVRHAQSVYTEPGELSWAQRDAETLAQLELLVAVARRDGWRSGYQAGHRDGRMDAWRAVGARALVDVIRREMAAMRRDLDALGVGCVSEVEP